MCVCTCVCGVSLLTRAGHQRYDTDLSPHFSPVVKNGVGLTQTRADGVATARGWMSRNYSTLNIHPTLSTSLCDGCCKPR